MEEISLKPIGIVHSPYKQKFAIPRQPNLVPAAIGKIELHADYADLNCLRNIDQFSHLWILFFFHATALQGWSPTVQPPRLGSQEKVGVFASRSPFRPNPLGISVVKNLGYKSLKGKITIEVGGIDILDRTPVIDIKPYIPYADILDSAEGGYATEKHSSNFEVGFSEAAEKKLAMLAPSFPELKNLISQVLAQDPRPAWRIKDQDEKQYGMTLFEFNIKWQVNKDIISVTAINEVEGI